jgi:hypothetical protein
VGGGRWYAVPFIGGKVATQQDNSRRFPVRDRLDLSPVSLNCSRFEIRPRHGRSHVAGATHGGSFLDQLFHFQGDLAGYASDPSASGILRPVTCRVMGVRSPWTTVSSSSAAIGFCRNGAETEGAPRWNRSSTG